VIDLAVGVLVGLRGCSQEEAFVELVEVVRQTRAGIGTIATELVALASGATSTNPARDLSAWAELIRQRRPDPAR
jgi:ANTAR domain